MRTKVGLPPGPAANSSTYGYIQTAPPNTNTCSTLCANRTASCHACSSCMQLPLNLHEVVEPTGRGATIRHAIYSTCTRVPCRTRVEISLISCVGNQCPYDNVLFLFNIYRYYILAMQEATVHSRPVLRYTVQIDYLS